jgi:hypothetical protein
MKCNWEVTRLRHGTEGSVRGHVRGTRQWVALLGMFAIVAALLRPGCDLLGIKEHAGAGAHGFLSASVDLTSGLEFAGLHGVKHGESHDDTGCCSSVDRFALVAAQEVQVPIFAKAQWTDLPPLAAPQSRLVATEMAAGRRLATPAQQLPVRSYYARSARLLL